MASSSDLRDLVSRLEKAKARRELAQAKLAADQKELEATQRRKGKVEQAQALLQTTAKRTQGQLKFHVQALVQNALDAVFPATYIFKVEFELRRGQTEMDIWLDKDGEQISPMDAAGGGVVDVITFALRVVAWSLSRSSPVLVLDEPFKWVSAGLRPVCGEILRGIADKLGLQIIMVTHDPELVEQADRIFVVDQVSRRSRVQMQEGTRA
jgi:DNA repair ATPase RecN